MVVIGLASTSSDELLATGVKLSVDADVVVREFAHLGVVDTDYFGFFVVEAEGEAWDEVHDP